MVTLNQTLKYLTTPLLVLVLLIPCQKSMASPEEYPWLFKQTDNCIHPSVLKHCELPQETQVSKLKLPMEQSKLFESLNLENSQRTNSVEFGLIGVRDPTNSQLVTYRRTSTGQLSLLELPLKASIIQSLVPLEQSIHIIYRLQF